MSIRDTIEREIQHLVQRRTDLITEDTTLASERRQLEDRLRAIAREQESHRTERGDIEQEIEAANRALAVLVEHQPTPPPVPEPEPAPTPASPSSPASPAKARAGRRRYSRDPSVVHTQKRGHQRSPAEIKGRVRLTNDQAEPIDLTTVSPTIIERADLVYEILREAENKRLSQYALALELKSLLDGDPPLVTCQGIVSDCLAVLIAQHRVVFTGEKVAASEGGKRSSPVWRVATPPEQACAGLPVGDDAEYEGTTTRPASKPVQYDGPGRVAVDSSGFETKR